MVWQSRLNLIFASLLLLVSGIIFFKIFYTPIYQPCSPRAEVKLVLQVVLNAEDTGDVAR